MGAWPKLLLYVTERPQRRGIWLDKLEYSELSPATTHKCLRFRDLGLLIGVVIGRKEGVQREAESWKYFAAIQGVGPLNHVNAHRRIVHMYLRLYRVHDPYEPDAAAEIVLNLPLNLVG